MAICPKCKREITSLDCKTIDTSLEHYSGDVENVEMTICDVVGQVVYKGNAEVKAGNLDKDIQLGTNLADGIYLLNINTGTEKQVIRFNVNR